MQEHYITTSIDILYLLTEQGEGVHDGRLVLCDLLHRGQVVLLEVDSVALQHNVRC